MARRPLASQRQADRLAVACGKPAGPAAPQGKGLTGVGIAAGAISPIRPKAILAMDFQFDTTVDGHTK
ncbi:hypothetical protein CKW46_07225 [Mycobacterium liflandii]|nr:hypothetical protein CKW46_07225 [Mycobacterium liflandii]